MVAKPSITKLEEPMVEEVEQKPQVKTGGLPLTGRQLLTKFLSNDPEAAVTYRKVCHAIEILDRMEEQAKIQFIEQLVDTSDLVDVRCSVLVNSLANISWQSIPPVVMPRYKKFLCEVGVRHVCHTEVVYQSAAKNLLARMTEGQPSLSEEAEDELFSVAHQMIAHILTCFPMSAKPLMKILRKTFPHYTHAPLIYNTYIRHLIQISEYAPQLVQDIWELIVENCVTIDSFLSQKEAANTANADEMLIFRMEEDMTIEDQEGLRASESFLKLDAFSADVFAYLALKHNISVPLNSGWIRQGPHIDGELLFRSFLAILENRLLMSVNVRYTSFIWLYICSLDKTYPERLLDFFWSVITRPQRTQTDTRKAHGAANYLAAFLARAKFVKLDASMEWQRRIFDWLLHYVDHVSTGQVFAGGVRHGLFYAMCQAFFIIFSFRYREMVKSGDMEELRRWGLGRVVQSSLDPLKFVSRPVGLCFGAITRSLQLVYVNHVLSSDPSAFKPFEPSFPLDSYRLTSTEELIAPLMRRFSPMAEDVSNLSSVLRSNTKKQEEDEDSGMDFLDDDDLICDSTPGRPIAQQSAIFTVYSSSPGLCHFDSLR